MALYPSLEDMKIDQMVKAQATFESQVTQQNPQAYSTAPPVYDVSPSAEIYPALDNYMGLEFSEEFLAANMPEYSKQNQIATLYPREVAVLPNASSTPLSGMIAPLSGQSEGLKRAQVTHGIRELTLCKDGDGKVGLRVKAIDNGIFVCLVSAKSPAACVGLRFGDQILQVNDTYVAGFTMDKVHYLFSKSPVNGIKVVVRDRPFERTVTLHKDSVGRVGFQFKDGKIVSIVQDSSAARNGLLTEHHLLEVNGQNVIGVKDKEISKIIETGGDIITVTIIPSFMYSHMIKSMSTNLLKSIMDHSIPSF